MRSASFVAASEQLQKRSGGVQKSGKRDGEKPKRFLPRRDYHWEKVRRESTLTPYSSHAAIFLPKLNSAP
jgi:hypothetical protein